MDTLWIMGFQDEFREAVDAAVNIDFSSTTSDTINVFGTTIRYLGGFLAAYDLSEDQRVLDKSLELAAMLYAAFDTPNRMPITRWDFHKAAKGDRQLADEGVLAAEIGSLTLEFARLAQITHDNRWYDAVARVMAVFDQQQSSTNLPGMWPLVVNARAQEFNSGAFFTLGAMSDSVYEYLPKMCALLGGSELYHRIYKAAMTTAIEHTLFRAMVPNNEAGVLLTGPAHADEPGKSWVEPQAQHLACFAGGMFALGGRLMNEESHVQLGRNLTDGCVWAYKASELGIMPGTFVAIPCEDKDGDGCKWDENQWHEDVLAHTGSGEDSDSSLSAAAVIEKDRLRPGFASITDRRYILRPEAIASVFILYRITGDTKLLDDAWTMFSSINEHTRTDLANAAIGDVTVPSAPKYDSMESFWTAETLKYFYLVFSEPDLISLDEYVFNTEAHPFRRPEHKFWFLK
jgi:mannosyl-oligosaccharide alpha-1,2-mannosidase